LLTDGFDNVETKPFGPDQLKLYPVRLVAVKFNVPPTQTGVLDETATPLSVLPISTEVVVVREPQAPVVTVSVYIPDIVG
jgi:hypothetical protein